MTLEATFERIAIALEKMAHHAGHQAAPVAAAAPVPSTPVPMPAAAPAAAPAPAPAVPSGLAPFSDAKGLMSYTMTKYKELGPVKGAGIQAVITSLGHARVSEITPEQFGEFYAQVEAL